MSTTVRTPKPTALTPKLAAIPAELKRLNQWVGWRYVSQPNQAKPTKPPLDPKTGTLADVTDFSTWGAFAEAVQFLDRSAADGVGIVLTKAAGYVGLDFDHCVTRDDDGSFAIDPAVVAIIRRLDSYAELSPSGAGIRVVTRGVLPAGRRRRELVPGIGIEIYDSERFLTITGRSVCPDPMPIADATTELAALHAELFPAPEPRGSAQPSEWTADDAEIMERAFAAKNGPKLRRLHAGDRTGYPSGSEADQAHANGWAFWTKDPEQIKRLMHSGGAWREKWDKHASYLDRTIAAAIRDCPETYSPRKPAPLTVNPNGHIVDNVHKVPAEGLDNVQDSPPEPSLDACNLRVAQLERENAELRAQLAAEQKRNQRLQAENRDLRGVVSQSATITRNKKLGTAKPTAQAIYNELAYHLANETDLPEDGMFPIPHIRIAEKAGKSADAVANDEKKIAAAGGIRRETRTIPIQRINPETGSIQRVVERRVYIGLPEGCTNIIDFGKKLAEIDLRTGHGGRREKRCPHCNEDAGVRVTTSCLGCGAMLEEHDTPPESLNRHDAVSGPEIVTDPLTGQDVEVVAEPRTGILRHHIPSVDSRTKRGQVTASRLNRHDAGSAPPSESSGNLTRLARKQVPMHEAIAQSDSEFAAAYRDVEVFQ